MNLGITHQELEKDALLLMRSLASHLAGVKENPGWWKRPWHWLQWRAARTPKPGDWVGVGQGGPGAWSPGWSKEQGEIPSAFEDV